MNKLNCTLIILYHYTRCGSTVVGDILDQIPGVAYLGEIFNPDKEFEKILSREDFCIGESSKNSIENVVSYFESAIKKFSKNSSHVFIEVTQWDVNRNVFHTDIEDLFFELKNKLNVNIKFIHLVRNNTFRRYISSAFAESNRFYHSENEISEYKSILVDIDKMIESIKNHQYLFARHTKLFQLIFWGDYTQLSYENDIEINPVVAVSKILDFTGVRCGIKQSAVNIYNLPQAKYKKIMPRHASKYVVNYSDVVLALRQNGFGWMSE